VIGDNKLADKLAAATKSKTTDDDIRKGFLSLVGQRIKELERQLKLPNNRKKL
jgi:hypothetical protein